MPKRRMRRHSVAQPIDQPYRFIPLTQEQNAIVDTRDFDWISQWNWSARWCPDTKSFYAFRHGNIMMHHVILGIRCEVDHKNGDTLDNRRTNLRQCTHSQNIQNQPGNRLNTSGYKGIYFHECGKWQAKITCNGKRMHLGLFSTKEEAARAYDRKAKELHGDFAWLNFPEQSQ